MGSMHEKKLEREMETKGVLNGLQLSARGRHDDPQVGEQSRPVLIPFSLCEEADCALDAPCLDEGSPLADCGIMQE